MYKMYTDRKCRNILALNWIYELLGKSERSIGKLKKGKTRKLMFMKGRNILKY